MRLVRRRLLALALVVVTGQLASTAAASVVLGGMRATEAAARTELTCTCAHGASGECPMHKSHTKAGAATDRSSRECRLGNGRGDDSAMVLAVFFFAGPPVNRAWAAAPEVTSILLVAVPPHPLDVVRPFVSPPPRA